MKVSALAWTILASFLATQASAAEIDASVYAKPGQVVRVDGDRKLNVVCMGSGAPTVILEAGAGGYSTTWRKTQREIAKFTRVCSYDRAGYGFSDPVTRPSTAVNYVADLHAALAALNISGPIVLVSHSAGGLYASLYADLHLSEVAGLVFLDPLLAGQGMLYGQFLTADDIQRRNKALADDIIRRRNCIGFVNAGTLDQHAADCVRVPAGLTPDMAKVFGGHLLQAKAYQATLSEDEALYAEDSFRRPSEDDREEQGAARSYGNIPLRVLIAGDSERGPPAVAWRASIDRLAARSAQGRVVVVPASGHNIQLDQPDAVVAEVRDVWTAARSK